MDGSFPLHDFRQVKLSAPTSTVLLINRWKAADGWIELRPYVGGKIAAADDFGYGMDVVLVDGQLYPIVSSFVVAQSQSTTRRYSTLTEFPDSFVYVDTKLFESCQFRSNFATRNPLVCGVRTLE